MQAAKEKYLAGGRAGSAETFKQPTVSPLSSASSFEHKRNWLSRQVQVIMYTFTLVHVTDIRFCLPSRFNLAVPVFSEPTDDERFGIHMPDLTTGVRFRPARPWCFARSRGIQ